MGTEHSDVLAIFELMKRPLRRSRPPGALAESHHGFLRFPRRASSRPSSASRWAAQQRQPFAGEMAPNLGALVSRTAGAKLLTTYATLALDMAWSEHPAQAVAVDTWAASPTREMIPTWRGHMGQCLPERRRLHGLVGARNTCEAIVSGRAGTSPPGVKQVGLQVQRTNKTNTQGIVL